ncbi:MAG: T9SS type A sorting domain-containing protein [Saprospiraceae bacterium]|nr:T9SS type A sorting domain-containing protein [Saprospiraceae bacterium]
MDSDVTGTKGFGTTNVFLVQPGETVPAVDAGLILGFLPLEWLDFAGVYIDQYSLLNWTTGVEVNNSHFIVERRHESERVFTEIAQVKAASDFLASTHDYSIEDHQLNKSGVYYYKIKQVDHDASFGYSRTISIKVQTAKGLGVEIYPNPVDDVLKVELWINEDSHLEVSVFDEHGKNVLTQAFGGWKTSGFYTESLRTDLLSSGHYNLQIRTNSGIVNKKFTVAR